MLGEEGFCKGYPQRCSQNLWVGLEGPDCRLWREKTTEMTFSPTDRTAVDGIVVSPDDLAQRWMKKASSTLRRIVA